MKDSKPFRYDQDLLKNLLGNDYSKFEKKLKCIPTITENILLTEPIYSSVSASISLPYQQSDLVDKKSKLKLNRSRFRPYQLSKKTVLKSNNSPEIIVLDPDVEFTKSPLFDLLTELVEPTSLQPQQNIIRFKLSPKQAEEISNSRSQSGDTGFSVQVQIRLCKLDPSAKEHDDFIPLGIRLMINEQNIEFSDLLTDDSAGLLPQKFKPIDITSRIEVSPVENVVKINIPADANTYVAVINLVRKKTSAELFDQLKSKAGLDSNHTREFIKGILDEDQDIKDFAAVSLIMSFVCPLGNKRIRDPCRGFFCTHIECFDASAYLQANEAHGTWECPVCNRPAGFESLIIDNYFSEILSSGKLQPNVCEIIFFEDGTWDNYVPAFIQSDSEESNKGSEEMTSETDNSIDEDDELFSRLSASSNKSGDDFDDLFSAYADYIDKGITEILRETQCV
ncbi:E3 SUMO-protein ligase PIAS1 [Microplitis demolitor]|uniref:E3 SUMO-protein ligase PIAS1 n=1 Tax=Microplitis demolitor TaxID=69319 RepID=UPI0004CD5792|nr:E3 SUMO-protein ligase PIAS1 [Microplitis demolitor]